MTELQLQSQEARATQLALDLKQSLATNTNIAYLKDWLLFENYCRMTGQESLPTTPYIVVEFLSNVRTNDGAKYRPASLQRFVVSIRKKHKQVISKAMPIQHRPKL